jgi:hypothetical protein
LACNSQNLSAKEYFCTDGKEVKPAFDKIPEKPDTLLSTFGIDKNSNEKKTNKKKKKKKDPKVRG